MTLGDPPFAPDRGESDPLTARVTMLEGHVAELERRLADLATASPRPATAPAALVAQPAPAASLGSDRASPSASASSAAAPIGARLADRARTVDLETLIAGRWLNRVGLLAVAVGVAYFLKLAIDNAWVGPRGQVALGLFLGAGLLASTPWYLKRGYEYFADGIAGLGAAILYLALWAGGNYYHVFSSGLTFGFMIAVTGGMIAMAIARNSQPVAVMALLGGFTSPALVASGQDAQVTLFTYLAVLNAGLLALAWLRNWRAIDLPAFILTESYFWSWYVTYYVPAKLPLTAGFATLFFAMFLALPVLRAKATSRTDGEHRILVPSNAYAFLAVAVAMLWPDRRWTLTLATLLLSAAHVLAARMVPVREGRSAARLLLGGVALTIATLVIPIRLDASWTTLAWSIEGAVLVWTGFRIGVRSMRGMAFLLFAIAGTRVAGTALITRFSSAHVVLNERFLTAAITVACLGIALWTARGRTAALSTLERNAFAVLAVAVNVLAVLVLTVEVQLYFRASAQESSNALAEGLAVSLLWALYASGLMASGVRQAIAGLRWQALALFGLTIWKVLIDDMASLDGFYRVASTTALGLILLIVSFVYQRSVKGPRTS
ncbi:MAG: DUF2339 domain-containing protein [Acidobacteriota bacterium]